MIRDHKETERVTRECEDMRSRWGGGEKKQDRGTYISNIFPPPPLQKRKPEALLVLTLRGKVFEGNQFSKHGDANTSRGVSQQKKRHAVVRAYFATVKGSHISVGGILLLRILVGKLPR